MLNGRKKSRIRTDKTKWGIAGYKDELVLDWQTFFHHSIDNMSINAAAKEGPAYILLFAALL